MYKSNNIQKNRVVTHALPITLMSSITLFTTVSWGRYVLLVCLVMILLVDIFQNRFRVKVKITGLFLHFILLVAYTFLSTLWAEEPSSSITNGRTLLEILIMLAVLYNHYMWEDNPIESFMLDIKVASFIIVISAIAFYGIDNLIVMAKLEQRMYKSFANVNTIGMIAAIGVLIQIDECIVSKSVKLLSILCIPSVTLIALTQSRKALVMLVLGITLILWCRNIYSKNTAKTIVKTMIFVGIGIILINEMLQIPIFAGVMERMEGLYNGFIGGEGVDNSTAVRNKMVSIGWEQFLETPLFGLGMGNSYVLTSYYFGERTYLHNNFIELLACGGIVGFLLYYSIYIYFFYNLWKLRDCKNKEFVICLIIMVVMLIMDWGRTSYYAKTQCIYMLLYFIEIEQLKRIKRENTLRNNYEVENNKQIYI